MMIIRKSKQLLSVILAVCMIVPLVSAGGVIASAGETDNAAVGAKADTGAEAGADQETTKPPAYDPEKATVGQYTEDELEASLLVRHTGKTSEIMESSNYVRDQVDPDKYSNEDYSKYFHTTSAKKSVYDTMGFSYEQLQSDAKDYAADPDCQNPLAGYSYIDPNELIIGDCNRTKEFDTYLHTYDNVDTMQSIPSNNFDSLTKNTDDYFFHDDDNNWNTICSNAIGIDADGDGTDELAYYSLQQKENDNDNMQKGTYVRVQLYDRVSNGSGGYKWEKKDEYRTFMQGSNYFYGKFHVLTNRSYVTLAAGDYDGDGKEELAYYMPDKGGDDDAKDARVIIENFDLADNGSFTHSEMAKFYLRDFCGTDYDMMNYYFGKEERLPSVALSTTSTRLGDVVNPNPDTSSAKRYHTYDDLVVSVSIPLYDYQLWNIVYHSVTQIFGMKDGKIQTLFEHEYKDLKNYNVQNRTNPLLTSVNTCDADLNGDGFKEIIVAGYCQYTDFGIEVVIDPGRIGVNIITYNNNDKCYEMLWDTEKILDQTKQKHGQMAGSPGTVYPPIPLCTGRFLPEKLDLKEQVFINGFIYDLKNTKVTGKPLYYSYNSHGVKTNYVADTQPGFDKQNFPVDEVVFEENFYYDLDGLVNQNFQWYYTCASGRFIEQSRFDQIVLTSGDQTGYWPDTCYMNVSILSYSDTAGKWEVTSHDNYMPDTECHSNGTSLIVTFIDSEQDTAAYRWMGSYCSYSAPALYSIVQVPPYYKEANKMYAYDFSLIVGNSEDSAVDWGAGACVEAEAGAGVKVISSSVAGEFELKHLNNRTWSHDRSLTRSFDIESEEDCVVCYVTPIVMNVYEVYKIRPSAEELKASDEAYNSGTDSGKIQHDIVKYTMMEEPIFTVMPISKYNEAVDEQNKKDDGQDDEPVSDDVKLEKIDPLSLPKTTWGDPTAYDHNLNDAIGKSKFDDHTTAEADLSAAVENDKDVSLVGTEIEFGYGTSTEQGTSYGLQLGVKIGIEAGFFKTEAGIAFAGDLAKTEGTGSMDGVSFGTTYYPPTAENQLLGSLRFDSAEETYSDGIPVSHYDVEKGTWYNYTADSVCYRTNYKGGGTMGVYSHGFYTQMNGVTGQISDYSTPADINYVLPPEQPMDFSVQSVRKHDDGSLDVTLIWDNLNRNKHRKTDGYNIYMEDANKNHEGEIHLQNKEGIIKADPDSHYLTYTIHLGARDYRDEGLSFYLAPAYYYPYGESYRALEGTIGLKASIADVKDINKSIIITKQPDPYMMNDNNSDELATFSVEAELSDEFHPTDNSVTFKWMKHRIQSDKWEVISEETLTEPDANGKFRSTCSFDIKGDEKESYRDAGVFCEIKCGNTTQNTDLVLIGYKSSDPVEPMTEPATEPTTEPATEPTVNPEPSGLAIGSYDELLAFAGRVNNGENTLDAYLTNNIVVPGDAEWSAGIGNEIKSYNGTFDGRGYCIIGLNINISDNGALFGIIGVKGVVRDLSVIGCSFKSDPNYGGGIAAFNYGTIDHCISGENLTQSGQYNSTIKGSICGGITARNKGTVKGCRNASVVEGFCCGGIAGINDGVIYGCASNGTVGTETAASAGGIAGENSGTIKSSYISGDVACKDADGLKGWVAAKNSSADVENVLYPTSDSTKAFGSSTADTGENVTDLAASDMKKPLFVKIMNELTDDTVTWVQAQYGDTFFNQGYPTIQGRYHEQRELTLQNGITISGLMHSDLHIVLEELSADSDEYKALAENRRVISAYSVRTCDAHGNYVPSELWNAGGYRMTVPTNGKNITLVALNTEGKLVNIAADKIENGNAVFTFADIKSLAVIEYSASSYSDATSSIKDSAKDKTTGNSTSGSNGTVQTGEALPAVMILATLCALCAFLFMKKRFQKYPEEHHD